MSCQAACRLIPGGRGIAEAARDDSFSQATSGLLEAPVYTKPPVWRGRAVPDVLLSGDHARIAAWRAEQSRERTRTRRPDLIDGSAG